MLGRGVQIAAVLGLATLVAGCGSSGSASGEGGNTFSNLLLYGGTTVPPVAPTPPVEAADCPPVTVTEGGAAIRSVAGGAADAASVRSQLSITEVARECIERPDGATVVKVGVQVRALLGPGGTAAKFDHPVSITIRRGEQVIASQSRRVSIAVSSGQYEQSAVVVVDGLVVPPGAGEYDIEVGLGAGGGRAAAPARRRGRS